MKKALLVSSLDEGSETFVKRHIELLGSDVLVIYGGLTPFKTDTIDESNSVIAKIMFRIHKLSNRTMNFRDYLLSRILEKNKIDICYAEFGPVGAGALAACKDKKVDLIVNFHGYDAFRTDILSTYQSQYKRLFDYCKRIVVVSQSMKQQLVSLGCKQEKLVYMPCYPSPKFGQLNYSPKKKRITFVGRFVEKKAPWLLIIAFKDVVQQHPDAELYLAGDGPLKAICESIVNALKIPNVNFAGMVEHSELQNVLAETMIYAQHSIIASNGDREGTPVSVMEALSAGIPTVSTKHEGIVDIINSENVGFLVNEQDAFAMAGKICELLGNEELRASMSKKAKIRAGELFQDDFGREQFTKLFE